MKLSALRAHLEKATELHFALPDGSEIPSHFHVTEVGIINRHFIDCGGTTRSSKKVNFQLWTADDTDHRLTPEGFIKIMNLSNDILQGEDLEVEIEYQLDTIGKFGLDVQGDSFVLTNTHTDCLAREACAIPEAVGLPLATSSNSCSPGSGCC